MIVQIDPDEQKSTSLFPSGFSSPDISILKCRGLEKLTGADFVISSLPVKVQAATLDWHLEDGTIFVQRKSGYDFLSFDSLKKAISRVQKHDIPPWQFVFLLIGNYQEAKDGRLFVGKSQPHGQTTYKTYIKLKAKLRTRGASLDWIETEQQLEKWIIAQFETIDEAKLNKKVEIFSKSEKPKEERDHIFQDAIEIGEGDWRYLFLAGVPGVGIKTVNSIREYCLQAWGMSCGYYALKATTEVGKEGKAVHKIGGWGPKSLKKLRGVIGLPDGFNLFVSDMEQDKDPGEEFTRGVYAALNSIQKAATDGKGRKGKDILENVRKAANEFFRLEE